MYSFSYHSMLLVYTLKNMDLELSLHTFSIETPLLESLIHLKYL